MGRLGIGDHIRVILPGKIGVGKALAIAKIKDPLTVCLADRQVSALQISIHIPSI